MSNYLLEVVWCGYFDFGKVVLNDYQGLWVDLPATFLCLLDRATNVKPQVCWLHYEDGRNTAKLLYK